MEPLRSAAGSPLRSLTCSSGRVEVGGPAESRMVDMTGVAQRDRPVLVLISGLQGTGKTTLAVAVAAALEADQTMLVAETLVEGRNVVVECVMAPELRQGWAADAAALGAACIVVECVCSDVALHEQRVMARYASESSVISWQRVLDDAKTYEPAREPDYLADAVFPVQQHVYAVVTLARRES
jgi:2-phosphoglycerate kinase